MLVMDDFCTNKILKSVSLSCFCFSWLMIWVTKLWIKFGLGFCSLRFAADQKGTFFLRCQVYPEIEWGKNIRVVLDVGYGVASFGGYLFDKDVITMLVAPKAVGIRERDPCSLISCKHTTAAVSQQCV